ncbi:MAG: hypothetical protein LDL31_01240 [Prosthecobacter sp.]|jgi:uncharacterized protein|nr:hypothetical protein [Prosthecobacter sp.]
MNPLLIDARHLPADGVQIRGNLPKDFFALPETDPVKVDTEPHYALHVMRDGDELVVSGRLEAGFTLECGRCLETFQHRVELPTYQAEVPLEKDGITDLTDLVREDILLTLPNFPRCEDGNVKPRECPAKGRFDTVDDSAVPSETPGNGGGVWDALDQIQKN